MTVQYLVCDSANIDPTTQQCSQVQYVQAPTMLPPLDASSGGALAIAIITLWVVAAIYKSV